MEDAENKKNSVIKAKFKEIKFCFDDAYFLVDLNVKSIIDSIAGVDRILGSKFDVKIMEMRCRICQKYLENILGILSPLTDDLKNLHDDME